MITGSASSSPGADLAVVGVGPGVHVGGLGDELLVAAVERAGADPLHRDAAPRDRGAQAVDDLGERVDVEGLGVASTRSVAAS